MNSETHQAYTTRLNELIDKGNERTDDEHLLTELLAIVVSDYEDRHWPVPLPSPIEAVRFLMERKGLRQKDLAHAFGSSGKVSEFFSSTRPLSLRQIRKLYRAYAIPAEILIQEKGVDYE